MHACPVCTRPEGLRHNNLGVHHLALKHRVRAVLNGHDVKPTQTHSHEQHNTNTHNTSSQGSYARNHWGHHSTRLVRREDNSVAAILQKLAQTKLVLDTAENVWVGAARGAALVQGHHNLDVSTTYVHTVCMLDLQVLHAQTMTHTTHTYVTVT